MQVSVKDNKKFKVLSLSGEVDLYESPKAREQILDCLKSDVSLLIDLSAVSYIDSSGIASLVEGLQLAREKKLDFALISISHAAIQVLKLARLDQVFSVYDTVDDYRNTVGKNK